MKNIYFILMLFVLSIAFVNGQSLDYNKQIEIVLSDGLNIKLYGSTEGNGYYYLPPDRTMRLGQKEDGTPEFLYVKYTTNEKADLGGVQGAILHFLLQWNLTPLQSVELTELLMAEGYELKGPVELEPIPDKSFQITTSILNNKDFNSTLITSGNAPALPGGKAAVAAKLDKYGAQLLASTFEKSRSISDISVTLAYNYYIKINAAKGKIVYKWSRTEGQYETLAYDYLKKELDGYPQQWEAAKQKFDNIKNTYKGPCGKDMSGVDNILAAGMVADQIIGNTSLSNVSGGDFEYSVGESRMKSIYEYLMENEVVSLEWEENLSDERVAVFREAFFNFFLNFFDEVDTPEFADQSQRLAIKDPENKLKDHAEASYSFTGCSTYNSNKFINKTITLDKIVIPIKKTHYMTTNLASTYDQVRDNKKCVQSVVLDDPFFQHRDINLLLDIEAEDIFAKEINSVTVNVRKKRSSGHDFTDSKTFTRSGLAKTGSLQTITYARGEDKNSDNYEYKALWSLKGGENYPENPRWIKGDWQGVTLAAPIKPVTVEFEADVDKMNEMKLSRAILVLRYYKYGQEYESTIHLSPSKKESIKSATIYMDRETNGYVYSIVYFHKDEGRLATEWSSKVNDNYVYANIPNEFIDKTSALFNAAKKAAELLLNPSEGATKVDIAGGILDQFKEIVKLFTKN